ncbi:hypothetical protein PUN28_019083 [Cardiocondyla obscurior]|uniref:Uncharacterized protein n=1 Tax=Cardiocondyla obscurior TaxID=286306 RepID=A0AAW2EFF7_9HYME
MRESASFVIRKLYQKKKKKKRKKKIREESRKTEGKGNEGCAGAKIAEKRRAKVPKQTMCPTVTRLPQLTIKGHFAITARNVSGNMKSMSPEEKDHVLTLRGLRLTRAINFFEQTLL